MKKLKGQKLWDKAKTIIPGGNMLLSKRSEQFLPEIWPSYFSKAKGCEIWDLDNKRYLDLSIMAIGTNILGYGNEEVDNEVRRIIKNGNMSSLNCPEEVHLAEKLIEMHPWADMVKYARTGGEANAIAVRIARSAAKKDNIAICGYHGWHDWYLAANLENNKNLNEHLLPGLDTSGVPKDLKSTVFPFEYNDFEKLKKIVKKNNIGVIKMEVSRSENPNKAFLGKVRKLATENGIVLIFDECTSGFRETLGGIHKKFNVEPDMAIFGKAIGNGYALTAVIGKREVMEHAQSSFISSTFWTERIGPAAALKTIEVMEKEESWKVITELGKKIKRRWEEIFSFYEIKSDIWGISALPGFTLGDKFSLEYKTLITQEMLKEGFLAGNSIYVCTQHTEKILDKYFDSFEKVIKLIQKCENGKDVYSLLEGPVCHSGFKRLN